MSEDESSIQEHFMTQTNVLPCERGPDRERFDRTGS